MTNQRKWYQFNPFKHFTEEKTSVSTALSGDLMEMETEALPSLSDTKGLIIYEESLERGDGVDSEVIKQMLSAFGSFASLAGFNMAPVTPVLVPNHIYQRALNGLMESNTLEVCLSRISKQNSEIGNVECLAITPTEFTNLFEEYKDQLMSCQKTLQSNLTSVTHELGQVSALLGQLNGEHWGGVDRS